MKETKSANAALRPLGVRSVLGLSVFRLQILSGTSAPGNEFHHLVAKGNTADILRRKALFSLPGWPGTDTMSTEPLVIDVDTREDEDEDVTELTAAEAAMAAENERDWTGP
ncbi:hypothetical protein K505DRAFT_344160 [Melanomma pulvis-pyrius CBS 109.77]|uniref:Uncharacterized protein n=1 Tax=Melanomma pulvis-pyrius CBS 109.77 TaxID=1314802 RepID=A0A6A6WQ00_9PLEO|nr:hypothetical protein K505DRAFT_344160 [Melanomma pulvis-pyrius CBS 109.77]